MLNSFGQDVTAVVIGLGGIGQAFVQHLCDDPAISQVYAFGRTPMPAQTQLHSAPIDILCEESIAGAFQTVAPQKPQIVIVTNGILHDDDGLAPEKSWRQLDLRQMEKIFRINTFGPALVAKHMLGHLPRDKKSVFAALSARVGSITDNGLGGWHSYRASKAALNMYLKGFSVELGHRWKQAACIALHPGTVDTGMSKPFQTNVPEGKLFTPAYSSGEMLKVIDSVTPEDSGKVFDYAGKVVPY